MYLQFHVALNKTLRDFILAFPNFKLSIQIYNNAIKI